MPVPGEASAGVSSAADQGRQRRLRTHLGYPIQEVSDPSPPVRPIMPTISSLLLHPSEPSPPPSTKKTHFSPAKFRALGCTASASQQVSVPAAIRTSADWERRKAKKKQKKGLLQKCSTKNHGLLSDGSNFGCNSSASCVVAEDAWCGPGIGLSAADAECVVAVGRRNKATEVPSRGKIDADRLGQRERPCLTRRTMNPDDLCFLDSDQILSGSRPFLNLYGHGPRHHRHGRHPSPEGLAEFMMLHDGGIMGGRLDMSDRYRGWRLDIDNMSYEQLLDLGDRIGHVNTGLKDDEISLCIRKIKLMSIGDLSHHFTAKTEGKCSICQEDYEEADDIGKLDCGHGYHLECITQWLSHKNVCPICKSEAVART
ncbi:hypothetical protein SAY87_004289 [Trapa incisa]|uniref:RING-type E3 ubiquitin transferase n=1 Tax=Trapa incisa TaxID=236973 RepID=A0AAN7JNL2_9MYRT|nr:hypothetical protein SAY87_004289 [Trapa incisa]